ncbi:MAG: hypothetical protein J2P36_19265 [Ktedonobacteraceae bacterium]|nr:hypothetical protein [Ktedonobacteraceae bacterium]
MTSCAPFFEHGKTITDLDIMVNPCKLSEMGHLVVDDEKKQAGVVYLVGHLFGQVSGHVIERQLDEKRLEENILKALRRELSTWSDAELILLRCRPSGPLRMP